ncbi:unnamed protein product [Brassicogethes aeneus]|uniref:SCP domain-containing protein n=1 Tax=Brassicogethes aeneus TaxID=1431903 RepID=A0A9P0B0U3_BRAAE|nr:unnamed protein product [Brassicogethes aeneus]
MENLLVLVVSDGPSSKCSGYKHFQFTKEMQEHIVLVHNDIREKVASGEENQGLLGGQPSASNMQKLEWDEELATIAQRWTDQCVQFNENQHDIYKDTRRFEVGQNIITATTKSTSPPDIVLLVMNWYKQVQYVFPSDIDKFTTVYRGGHMLGQYSQMVWAKSHYVGCGMARYKKLTVENKDTDFYLYRLVCNYGPTGNVYGEQMYLRGRPCSRCAQKQCDEKWTSLCDRRSSFNILNRYNILMDFPSEYEVQGEPEQENTYYFNPDETQLFKQKTGHLLEDLVINNINEEQLNITEKMNDFYHVISPNKPQVHNVVKDIEDELQFNIPTEGFTVKTTTSKFNFVRYK